MLTKLRYGLCIMGKTSQSKYMVRNNSALAASIEVRTNWTKDEIQKIYDMPLLDLVFQAASVHRTYFNPREVQQCTLLSIKTGGCSEDCKYCSQSSSYKTPVKPTPTMKAAEVLAAANAAKESGSTRFCMGAAWREVGKDNKDKKAFEGVLDLVRQVKALDMEAVKLKDAGLTAYNHNLDTSREFYPQVISTRTYDDRLATIEAVRNAGLSVCCGGILGLGETEQDRVGLLHTIATLPTHPESVPINALVPVEGTPLNGVIPPSALDMARMIATTRIVLPKTVVRLSAGRMSFTDAEQAMMFLAGANSIFYGDKLLTTANPETDRDKQMLLGLGMVGKVIESNRIDTESKASAFFASSTSFGTRIIIYTEEMNCTNKKDYKYPKSNALNGLDTPPTTILATMIQHAPVCIQLLASVLTTSDQPSNESLLNPCLTNKYKEKVRPRSPVSLVLVCPFPFPDFFVGRPHISNQLNVLLESEELLFPTFQLFSVPDDNNGAVILDLRFQDLVQSNTTSGLSEQRPFTKAL
eukprot:gene1961-3809_t